MSRRSLAFELHHCREWMQPKDLFEGLELAIRLARLIPLENRYIQEPKPVRPVAQNWESWFHENYYCEEAWDAEEFSPLESKERIAVFMRTPLEESWVTDQSVWGATRVQFSAESYGEAYNVVRFSCGLSEKSSKRPSQLHRVDEVMGLFVAFAQPVIERLGPTYAIVTEGYPKATYGREILSATLKHIHWCNYYGPTYLKKYGEDVFLNAPGWHSERLGEGIWYQTAERFDDSKDELLKQQILEHFKPIDVRKVV